MEDYKNFKAIQWEWDEHATFGYNIIARFETTLLNFGIAKHYMDIEDTEYLDKKYGNICVNKGLYGEQFKRDDYGVKFITPGDKKSDIES